jgi:hypothetical protein
MPTKSELQEQVDDLTAQLEKSEADRKAGWGELHVVYEHVVGALPEAAIVAEDVTTAIDRKAKHTQTALQQAEDGLRKLAAEKSALEADAPTPEAAPAPFTLGQVSDVRAREEIRTLRGQLAQVTAERDDFAKQIVARK